MVYPSTNFHHYLALSVIESKNTWWESPFNNITLSETAAGFFSAFGLMKSHRSPSYDIVNSIPLSWILTIISIRFYHMSEPALLVRCSEHSFQIRSNICFWVITQLSISDLLLYWLSLFSTLLLLSFDFFFTFAVPSGVMTWLSLFKLGVTLFRIIVNPHAIYHCEIKESELNWIVLCEFASVVPHCGSDPGYSDDSKTWSLTTCNL